MIPNDFSNYFLGSAGAGAALVGLLFLAVSIAPEQTLATGAPIERQVLANSVFTALTNAFLVSVSALIPGTNLGYVAIFFGVFGLLTSLRQTLSLLGYLKTWSKILSRMWLLGAGFIIYGLECISSLILIFSPQELSQVYTVTILILCMYMLALIRTWQLLGAKRFGLRRLLKDLDEDNWQDTAKTEVRSERKYV